ncbi:hypothetical protein CEXT_197051 [Caerostris extrusa]|uniref:Secreted protein n=1 Tax=Caerostris extrusa TaxID=172846 RepID=A0AAV4S995_CAEEX|nr:hypothetical protein CEXT_197051 [Caerostris extrusa]
MFLFTSLLIPGSSTLSYYRPPLPGTPGSLSEFDSIMPTTVDNLLVRNECQMVRVIAFPCDPPIPPAGMAISRGGCPDPFHGRDAT